MHSYRWHIATAGLPKLEICAKKNEIEASASRRRKKLRRWQCPSSHGHGASDDALRWVHNYTYIYGCANTLLSEPVMFTVT